MRSSRSWSLSASRHSRQKLARSVAALTGQQTAAQMKVADTLQAATTQLQDFHLQTQGWRKKVAAAKAKIKSERCLTQAGRIAMFNMLVGGELDGDIDICDGEHVGRDDEFVEGWLKERVEYMFPHVRYDLYKYLRT